MGGEERRLSSITRCSHFCSFGSSHWLTDILFATFWIAARVVGGEKDFDKKKGVLKEAGWRKDNLSGQGKEKRAIAIAISDS